MGAREQVRSSMVTKQGYSILGAHLRWLVHSGQVADIRNFKILRGWDGWAWWHLSSSQKEWSSAIVPQKNLAVRHLPNLRLAFWVRLLFSMSVSVFVETLPNRSGNFWTSVLSIQDLNCRKTIYFKLWFTKRLLKCCFPLVSFNLLLNFQKHMTQKEKFFDSHHHQHRRIPTTYHSPPVANQVHVPNPGRPNENRKTTRFHTGRFKPRGCQDPFGKVRNLPGDDLSPFFFWCFFAGFCWVGRFLDFFNHEVLHWLHGRYQGVNVTQKLNIQGV